MIQASLFDLPPSPLPDDLPDGLIYADEFLGGMEERHSLIEIVGALPLEAARYKAYTARRRVVSYGGSFDYDSNRLTAGGGPDRAAASAARPGRAAGLALTPAALAHTLVARVSSGRAARLASRRARLRRDRRRVARQRSRAPIPPFPPAAQRSAIVRLPLRPDRSTRCGVRALGLAAQRRAGDALRWSITFPHRAAALQAAPVQPHP